MDKWKEYKYVFKRKELIKLLGLEGTNILSIRHRICMVSPNKWRRRIEITTR